MQTISSIYSHNLSTRKSHSIFTLLLKTWSCSYLELLSWLAPRLTLDGVSRDWEVSLSKAEQDNCQQWTAHRQWRCLQRSLDHEHLQIWPWQKWQYNFNINDISSCAMLLKQWRKKGLKFSGHEPWHLRCRCRSERSSSVHVISGFVSSSGLSFATA